MVILILTKCQLFHTHTQIFIMHNFSSSEQFASISRILPLNFVKFQDILWLHPREILGYFLLFILNHKALVNFQSSIRFLKLRYQIHQLSYQINGPNVIILLIKIRMTHFCSHLVTVEMVHRNNKL